MRSTPDFSFEVHNRRGAKRRPLTMELDNDGSPATSINISMTGIRYFSPTPVPVGSRKRMQLAFGEQKVNLVSEAVWSQSYGPGCIVGASFQPGSELAKLSSCLKPVRG